MVTTYYKDYESKPFTINIFHKYFFSTKYTRMRVADIGVDFKFGPIFNNFGNTKYIGFLTKKFYRSIMFHYGKYDPSCTCSC